MVQSVFHDWILRLTCNCSESFFPLRLNSRRIWLIKINRNFHFITFLHFTLYIVTLAIQCNKFWKELSLGHIQVDHCCLSNEITLRQRWKYLQVLSSDIVREVKITTEWYYWNQEKIFRQCLPHTWAHSIDVVQSKY